MKSIDPTPRCEIVINVGCTGPSKIVGPAGFAISWVRVRVSGVISWNRLSFGDELSCWAESWACLDISGFDCVS